MFKFDLQLCADAVHGKKIAYLYRLLSEASKSDAAHVAFTTENSTSISRDADAIATKDGSIRTLNEVEIEISTTAILAVGDTMIEKLKKALIDGEKVEIWEVNLAEAGSKSNTFKARYYQGYVTEFEQTSSAEDHVECTLNFGIEGCGAEGDATVSEAQQVLIETYGFADTTKTGA